MQQLLIYGIVGRGINLRTYLSSVWAVAARFSLEEAEQYLKALDDQAVEFNYWCHRMRLANSADTWEDLTAEYIERHMLDKQFSPGATYEILCFKEDSCQ